jgi:hypothetical protein
LLRFAVARLFRRLATVFLLFAGLPAAQLIIMGVGFLRRFFAVVLRFRAEFLRFRFASAF